MSKSEVARLRTQIELELEAVNRGMNGLAIGRARHDFIHARMQRIGTYQDTLACEIGDEAATQVVCQLYYDVIEKNLP